MSSYHECTDELWSYLFVPCILKFTYFKYCATLTSNDNTSLKPKKESFSENPQQIQQVFSYGKTNSSCGNQHLQILSIACKYCLELNLFSPSWNYEEQIAFKNLREIKHGAAVDTEYEFIFNK